MDSEDFDAYEKAQRKLGELFTDHEEGRARWARKADLAGAAARRGEPKPAQPKKAPTKKKVNQR